MELALHAPGLGYYSAGMHKFGAAGDFVTAPELGSLFGATLARQAAQILRSGNGEISEIIECGAGSGRLACDLLRTLADLDCLPQRYCILETSADLRARQQALLKQDLPQLASRVIWIDTMPAAIDALVIANEVLDAMPAHVVKTRDDGIDEVGVAIAPDETFMWQSRPAAGALLAAAQTLGLAPGYTTEIGLQTQAFVRTLAASLRRGVALLIDYGFPAREYYHPQRNEGTLMCHYRHYAHADPLCLVGLQDITVHVDFSAVAAAAVNSGCAVLGYANQAQFLVNCGVTDVLAATPSENIEAYLPLVTQAQTLLSPAEMGELFKVIAFGRNHSSPLLGFASGNKQGLL
jgi:SAM-dependent MidA family methyltransferase